MPSATPTTPAPTTPAATDTTDPSTGTDSTPASPTPDGPAFSSADTDLEQAGSGDAIAVTDVRTGSHATFDRVVFDIAGSGDPGWFASYTNEATQAGSGKTISMDGAAFLQVIVRGTALPMDAPAPPFDDETVPADGLSNVVAIHNDNIFEGQQLFYLGVQEETAYRVFLIEDPARLVVDVKLP